ncbi:MFS transporter [Limosilactobacillus mucosae]|uniref:MFS transporter n=1 Tax=Limosilactobacillus mucosae TaxID=97478 RepID=UPI003991FD44
MTFIGVLNETSMNVAYPVLAKEFGVSLDVVQWITGGYLLMVTIVMGTTAYCLRQWAARWLHLAAVSAFMIGDLLCALAVSFPMLLAGRLIQAIATGFSTPMMFFLIFTQIPRERLGVMNGMAGMVISLAPALGPTYGGAVLATGSWRVIFWLILPLALLSLIAGQLTIRNQPVGNSQPFSFLALLLLAGSLFSIITGVARFGNSGWTSSCGMLLLLGLILFVGFVWQNKRGKTQLFDLSVFSQITVRFAEWTYFSLQFINIGASLVLPIYCEYVLHASSLTAGMVLLPGSLLGAVMAPLSGFLADRYGYGLPTRIGSVLIVLGTVGLLVFQAYLTPLYVMVLFIVMRLGFNAAFSNTIANASTLVSKEKSTDVNSIFNMTQQFAGSLGVGVMTALIALNQNNGQGSMAIRTFKGSRLDFGLLVVLAISVLAAVWLNFSRQQRLKNAAAK